MLIWLLALVEWHLAFDGKIYRKHGMKTHFEDTVMESFGLSVKGMSGSKRLELQCEHQNALVYVVPGEGSWVCSEELLHVHTLAGFLDELVQLNDPRVKDIMRKWGIYFRKRHLSSQGQENKEDD